MSATKKTGKIAVFIPAYDEEKSIGSMVLLAKKHGRVFVVDDGSQDRTAEMAGAAGAKVFRHPKNMGYGAAVRTAFSAAKKIPAQAFVFLDADFQHEAEEIPKVAQPVLSGEADVCLGSRFLGKFIQAPPGRKEGVMLINRLSNSRRNIDSQCGFRAFSKGAIGKVKFSEDGYAACAEIITSAQRAGLKIVEVPVAVRYYNEKAGATSQLAELLEYAARQVMKRNPLLLFGGSGIFMLAVSALLGFFVVETFYSKGVLPVGSAFLTVFAGVVGVILLSVAINLYALRLASEKSGKRES